MGQDTSQQVILPFPEQPAPRILTQTEFKRLLQACIGQSRDTAIVILLLQTGIRLSELPRLFPEDIHLPDAIDIVGSESRKGRIIPFNSKASEALQLYFSNRPGSDSLTKNGGDPTPNHPFNG